MKSIKITTEFIKLDQLLKLAQICYTGGHAKILIQEGKVKVNDSEEFQRGKKIYKGDVIKVEDFEEFKII